MSHNHFKRVWKCCGAIFSQCSCMDKNKAVEYADGPCDSCKLKLLENCPKCGNKVAKTTDEDGTILRKWCWICSEAALAEQEKKSRPKWAVEDGEE